MTVYYLAPHFGPEPGLTYNSGKGKYLFVFFDDTEGDKMFVACVILKITERRLFQLTYS